MIITLIVFILDIERHFFRYDLFSMRLPIRIKHDLIQWPDLIIRLNLPVVDQYHTCFERLLYLIPGDAFYA